MTCTICQQRPPLPGYDECGYCRDHYRGRTSLAAPAGSAVVVRVKMLSGSSKWSPMLKTGDLHISLYSDETLEIRDGQVIYVHLTKQETADFLRWLDARDKP